MKKRTLLTVLVFCLLMALAGCTKKPSQGNGITTNIEASGSANTESTSKKEQESTTNSSQNSTTQNSTQESSENSTQVATENVTDAPTQAPTEMPTEAPTEEVPRGVMGTAITELRLKGVVSSRPSKVTKYKASGTNVEIEKVETYNNSYIVVTLNAGCDNVNPNDIKFNKYSDNWYTSKPTTSSMTITDSYATLNDAGKTVLVYVVADNIDGTKAVTDTSDKKIADLSSAVTIADNYVSWQMDHGGWDKKVDEQAKAPWNGTDKKNKFSNWNGKNGEMLGTIDNDATYTQMRHIAMVYREVRDEKYKNSVLKGLDFIFKLQYESGGFAQVYPRRGNYSDMVTFNDDAMINVLIMLEDMRDGRYPFDSDILPQDYKVKVEKAIEKAIDYILKSQIESGGKLTAWCAQHDPVSYAAVGARNYELPSISGKESVAIIKFLMNQKQTPQIKVAVEAAMTWLKESRAVGISYVKDDPNGVYFVEDPRGSLWYRFYEIGTNKPIFCDRDGVKKYSIAEISEERRNGYSWSDNWGKYLVQVYDDYGYYPGRIEAKVIGTESKTADGKTLLKDSVKIVEKTIN